MPVARATRHLPRHEAVNSSYRFLISEADAQRAPALKSDGEEARKIFAVARRRWTM
jgi:hypothetical protein